MKEKRKQANSDSPLWFWSLVFLLAGTVFLLARAAMAAPEDYVHIAKRDPALILARALVAEAGYSPRKDHPAILHVLRKRTQRKDPVGDALLALQYCSVFKDSRQTRHAIKAREAPWEYLQSAAPEVSQLVRAWVRGHQVKDPCKGKAIHWGSRDDMHARDIDGRVAVDCGGTANVFLSAWKVN
jgi:hypothetical protein